MQFAFDFFFVVLEIAIFFFHDFGFYGSKFALKSWTSNAI